MSTIETKVISVVAEQLGISQDKVKPSLSVIQLGADSLDTVEIVMALESKFDLTIPENEVTRLLTIKDIVDYISKVKQA